MALAKDPVQYIETGDATSACITIDNSVYMWGSTLNGRLGNGDNGQNVDVPAVSEELKNLQITAIVMGSTSTFGIRENKQVFAWGSSKNGKLGFEMAAGKNYDLPK